MKITFLGTGAADWKREIHGDMEGFRRNSSVLIDSSLLIDPGPDVPDALDVFGKDPLLITDILNTHKHGDHYNTETVAGLRNATLHEMKSGEERVIGKYTVKALRANHSTSSDAIHFIIFDGESRLFYGLDGAWLMYDEVAAIKTGGVDLAVFDATVGRIEGDYRIFEHNDLNMVIEMKRALDKHVGRCCISHMARTLHSSHRELCLDMEKYGIEVAFDGWETEI